MKFLPFPKPKTNLERAKRWVHLCGRPRLKIETITRMTYICVKHFGRGENLDSRANLSLEPFPAHSEELFRGRHEEKLRLQPLTAIEKTADSNSEAAVSPLKVLKSSVNKTYSKKDSNDRFLPLNPPRPEKIDQIEGNLLHNI
jgi:hypothetical protein